MNIIEKRRRKAWAHATMVIMNKVIREASTGTIFIYGETLYGKDYFLTPDDALDAVLVTMGVLRKLWERDGVRPSKRLFAEVCPDRAIGAVVMKMWREPFRYWNLMREKWVVEVRRAHALEHRPGNWCCVAQCDDGQTAITVADALQNFMRTGLIGDDFHTRTRLVGEKGA